VHGTCRATEPNHDNGASKINVAGLLPEEDEMVVESLQPAGDVIFSDGVEQDFLEFNSGMVARVSVSSRQAKLAVG